MMQPSDMMLLDAYSDSYACKFCERRFGLPYGKPGWYASHHTYQTLNLVRANARRHALVCWRQQGAEVPAGHD